MGEEGSELLTLDFERPSWTRMAEMPRFPTDGGMRRLEILRRTGVALLHWEFGVLALEPSLELRWRHDLEWNHRLIYLDDTEVWFDLMYEAEDCPRRSGGAHGGSRSWTVGSCSIDARQRSSQPSLVGAVIGRNANASRCSIGFVTKRLGIACAFAFLYLRFGHEQDVHLERIATTRRLGARRFFPSCP